ncbi:MAG: efflux RND transporter periplasmic adaptor subunit [Planctomycetes bacterium]|nr:efflux RND transporter periplasmic adaptor subunit [Planctomycetota bacterium]
MTKNALLTCALVLLLGGMSYRVVVIARRGTSPRAHAPGAAPGEWCDEHGVAEADCFVCSPALVQARGACAEHGVPAAMCTRCRPDLAAVFRSVGDWCREHALPESQCTPCRPARAPPAPERSLTVVHDPTGADRSARPPSAACLTHTLRVRLKTPAVAREVGLEVVAAERRPFREVLTCNARVAWDADRFAHVAARAPGVIVSVAADLGRRVAPGDVLLTLDSAAVGEAETAVVEAAALAALWAKNHAREVDLAGRGVGTLRAVVDAETRQTEAHVALVRARQRLLNLGVEAGRLEALEAGARPGSLLTVKAPFAGEVVERHAVVGEVVQAGEALLVVADASRMWALIDVPEEEHPRVRPGQAVVVTVEAPRGLAVAGKLDWVSPAVDPRTRTVTARAVLDNQDGRLRAHLFGKARVTLHQEDDVVLVPREAVQWEGCCNVVFVRQSDTVYEPRKVTLGCATPGAYEVLDGLEAGEPIVTTGSFLLKTEILKGSIGAGCCEGEE